MRGFGSHRNPKRLADGHVSNDHFFSGRFVTNVVRRSTRISLGKDVFGTRQRGFGPEIGRGIVLQRASLEPVDRSVIKISVELESLILAQNERWRQA